MQDMKQAMKDHDKVKLNTVRMIKSALQNEQIRLGHDLTNDDELTVLNREKKQREESIADFKQGNRDDLVAETEQELAVVESYLPKQLSEAELMELAKQAIAQAGASSKSEFGLVMKVLMPKIKGRADGKQATKVVQSLLN